MNFCPEDCFVEFRGSEAQHREDDVMISDQDVDAMMALVQSVLSWELKLPLRDEGYVISLGVRTSAHRVLGEDPLNVVVTTGNGPKFIVNPGYCGVPMTLPKRVGDDRHGENRLVTLRDRLIDRLDQFIDWKEKKVELGPTYLTPPPYRLNDNPDQYKRPGPYPLLTIPDNDSPGFGSRGSNSRAIF